MVRRILICISLTSFIILSAPGAMHAGVVTPQNQSGNQNSDAKSVSGKVTAVGTDHKSFTLEINDNAGQRSMEFVLNDNTQVQGRVGTGTTATVEYQMTQEGKNLAITITPQNPPQQ